MSNVLFPSNYQVVLLEIKALVVETPRSLFDEELIEQMAEAILADGGIAEVIHVTHNRKLDSEGNIIYTAVNRGAATAHAAKIANERNPHLEHIYVMIVPQQPKQLEILDKLNGSDAERLEALKAEMAAIIGKY